MTINNQYRKFLIFIIGLIIVVVNIFRFYNLENVPSGFHVDELASAATIQCLATEGVDPLGRKPSLFFQLNFGTPKPPTYIYPGILWAKLFGFSIASFHGFTAFGYIISLIGLFFLAKIFFFLFLDSKKDNALSKEKAFLFAIVTMLVASISPWMWPFSRIAYESSFVLIFLIWGLYLLFKSNHLLSMIGAGFLFSCAAYSYPPTRAQLPFMLIFCGVIRHRYKPFCFRNLIVFIITIILFSFPVVIQTLDGSLQQRFNDISIFSKDFLSVQGKQGTFFDVLGIFLRNFILHFNPEFLFVSGDSNYMHSTHFCGIFSWVDIFALVLGVIFILMKFFRREKDRESFIKDILFIFFCFVNILIGMFPSALTTLGIPHALRIMGAWLFMMLLSGFFLYKFIERFPYVLECVIMISFIFISLYLRNYFTTYPIKSRGMFSPWTKQQALAAKTEQDWLVFMATYSEKVFHLIYYCMNYKPNETCSSCQKKWKIIYDYLHKKNPY
ncbi:MAG TPA: hypothetical protein PLH56_01885 [Candidatus Omnitrophota bacterium]|nr:hypothetical protein [Candidatus Omnitrophota bacterium]